MKTPYDDQIETTRLTEKRRELRVYRQVYLAALQSPEVRALRTALWTFLQIAYARDPAQANTNNTHRIPSVLDAEAALAPWKEKAP